MHPIDLAAFWPGYDVVASRPVAENTLLIELSPQVNCVPQCGRCQQPCPLIHERRLRLATVYLLKGALKEVRYAPSVREGWQHWKDWLRHARDSGLAPLQRFAKNLRRYIRGILASACFPMRTSLLEAVNNRIKVIRRMAWASVTRTISS